MRKANPLAFPSNPIKKSYFGRSSQTGIVIRGNQDKTAGGSGGNVRSYFCKICQKNHPGEDCHGNKVNCFKCGKAGHQAFECRVRIPGENQTSANSGNQPRPTAPKTPTTNKKASGGPGKPSQKTVGGRLFAINQEEEVEAE